MKEKFESMLETRSTFKLDLFGRVSVTNGPESEEVGSDIISIGSIKAVVDDDGVYGVKTEFTVFEEPLEDYFVPLTEGETIKDKEFKDFLESFFYKALNNSNISIEGV